MVKNSICVCLMVLLSVAGCNRPDDIYCIQLDPLEKVFKEQMYFVENTHAAAVAKGETASFQWIFRSLYPVENLKVEAGDLINGNNCIPASLKAFVGYVKAGSGCHSCGTDRLPTKKYYAPVSGLYPDPLLEMETINVPSMSNQPLWLGYTIPRDAAAGVYSAEITISGKIDGRKFTLRKQVSAKVYDVALPEQTLWVTNWYSPEYLTKMNDDQPVEPFSNRYWELLKLLANTMRDHGQNTYIIRSRPEFSLTDNSLPEMIRTEMSDGKYSFDFTYFDKTVEFLMQEGGLKRIEGHHLGSKLNGWMSDIGIAVPGVGLLSVDNDTVRNYLSQYIPALYSHLKSKDWDKIYIQHIADEPSLAPSYNKIAKFIRTLAPEMKIIEATILADEVGNSVDIHVPIIYAYEQHETFYKVHQATGNEVWFYISCDDPEGKYLNRFYERELIQSRLLHWFNYRYHITGYLHWGLNVWRNVIGNPDLYVDNEISSPSGDVCIVYPDYDKVYSSIRFEAQRDGIADYELLKLLEQKDAAKAEQLVKSVIFSYDNYNTDIVTFRARRIQLLEWLSDTI